jgi:hypothetical protein
VSEPGSEDWEATAAAWLLDLLPAYRQYDTLRRHPVVLAFVARHVIYGAVDGAARATGGSRANWATRHHPMRPMLR